MKKVLIVIPDKTALGGISNYYEILRKYFNDYVHYVYRGARSFPFKKSFLVEISRLINDYLKFIYEIVRLDINIVQTTTYMGKNAVLRDGVYILLAKVMGKKTIIFFRGWDFKRSDDFLSNRLFRKIFFHVDACIVLSKIQKAKLIEAGFNRPVFIETTTVDDRYFEIMTTEMLKYKYDSFDSRKEIKLLFLGRIEKEKGVFELLSAFKDLKAQMQIPEIKLIIAGNGKAFDDVKNFIDVNRLKDIELPGYVRGFDKEKLLKESDIFVLPSYAEGMPNSVLEAMAFGLPVITTPVGGLVDFFENQKNGFFVKIKNPESIIEKIQKLINTSGLMKRIALENHQYAKTHFRASIVAKRNESIFNEF